MEPKGALCLNGTFLGCEEANAGTLGRFDTVRVYRYYALAATEGGPWSKGGWS